MNLEVPEAEKESVEKKEDNNDPQQRCNPRVSTA
jgi:hypothetical protein